MRKSCLKGCFCSKAGFTLIELLVVVLIIGILAAVAVPQYQKAVEKSILAEAFPILRAIAQAHQVYYLQTGKYATVGEMGLLDIQIPGIEKNGRRIQTKHWVFSPTGSTGGTQRLALAQRIPISSRYYIYILPSEPQRFRCKSYADASSIQKELCRQIETNGGL